MRKKAVILLVFFIVFSTIFTVSVNALSIEEEIYNISQNDGLNSFSIAYIEDRNVMTYGSNGIQDTSSKLYEAGSNGKMIAAYTCLKLSDEEKLSLDDTIVQYLESDWITSNPRFQTITVRDLLSHTAGFSPSFETGVDKKLYFEPGSNFSYSGVGYIYLQKVIEKTTGQDFESAVQKYAFQPLNMTESTFKKAITVTPFVKASSLALYVIVIFSIITAVIYGICLLIGLITKFKFFRKIALFYCSITIGFVIELVLLGLVLPRFIIPAIIFGIVGLLVLIVSRMSKRLKYVAFISYVLALGILGNVLPITLPIGPALIAKEPNAAYSLITSTKDLTLFAEELLDIYNNGTDTMKEMFCPQIEIDGSNSWGAGIAIENIGDEVTYWHSGINPGMQSLFILSPSNGNAVIIMTNSDYGLPFAKGIARKILGIDGTWDIVRTDLSKLQ